MEGWVIALIIGGVIVVAVIIGVIVYKKEGFSTPAKHGHHDQHRPTLVLFSRDGCPHCERLKPTWEEVTKSLRADGRCHAMLVGPETMSQFRDLPAGVPTIRLYPQGPSGHHVDYQGDRSHDSIVGFALGH